MKISLKLGIFFFSFLPCCVLKSVGNLDRRMLLHCL